MKKFRLGIIVFALIFVAIHLSFIDYNNLSWKSNSGGYLGIVSMLLLIAAMISSQRSEENEKV